VVEEYGQCPAPRCRARIRWAPLEGGGRVPVDVELDAAGPLIPALAGGRRVVRARLAGDAGRAGFVLRWSRCPDPRAWAAERQAAERLAGPARDPIGRDRGPCAGCRRPGHVAYGPGAVCLLCAACRAMLEAWRQLDAGQRCRTPLVYPRWKDGGAR
jgi:hypothetical protein